MSVNPYESRNYVVDAGSSASVNLTSENSSDDSIFNLESAGYSLQYTTEITDKNIELIKKELQRKIDELKEKLDNSKNTKGFLSSIGNGIAEIFGGGDKGKQAKIENYETLLAGLDENPENILEVYQTIIGTPLDVASLSELEESNAISSCINSEVQEAIIAELESQLGEIESNFETAKKSNGWISGAWNAIKNATGIGASSNKTQAEINSMKEQLELLKNGKSDLAAVYKNITGSNLTTDELTSFLNGEKNLGETSNAGQAVDKYKEGQKMCVDTVADITSGIASIAAVSVCSAIGICAAPFTAGTSLGLVAAGLAIGGATGAVVKTALKASDCIGNEKEYTLQNFGYDTITGFANGMMGPLSNALGGAAGTGIMKAFGMQSLESTVIKSAAVSAAGEITQTAAKTLGQYTTKELAVTALAKGAQIVVDSGLSGMTDGLSRSIAQGDDLETTLENTVQSTLGAIIAAPIIGSGFKVAGKAGEVITNTKIGQEIGEAISNAAGKAGTVIGEVLPDNITTSLSKVSQDFGERTLLNAAKNSLTDNLDGTYDIRIGNYIVKVAKDELSDEILSDTTNLKLYQYAQNLLAEGLKDGVMKETIEDSGEGVINGIKSKIDDKLKKIHDGIMEDLNSLRIVQNYNKAKSALLNVPVVENPDLEVVRDYMGFLRQAQELVDQVHTRGTGIFDAIDGDISTISLNLDNILTHAGSINSEITQMSNENRKILVEVLEEIAQGGDPSVKMAELAQRGIDITTCLDDRMASLASEIEIRLQIIDEASLNYTQKAYEASALANEALDNGSRIVENAIDNASRISETSAYRQLGDLPSRTRQLYDSINPEMQEIKNLAVLAKERISAGDIDGGLQIMQQYYDALDVFTKGLDDKITAIQTTAVESGIEDSATIIRNRLQKLMGSEEFQALPREKQIQAVVEDTNILLSKFAQTFSSDSSMPDEVSSILKQFTSDGITFRTIEEAQKLADELYGQGKYVLKKSFGAGTIGETYLATKS